MAKTATPKEAVAEAAASVPELDEKTVAAMIDQAIATAMAAKLHEPSATFDDAGIKAWVRRELALAAGGASEAERETMNP